MAERFSDRIAHAWNAFQGKEQATFTPPGESYSYQGSRPLRIVRNDRTIIKTIYNQIAIDVASVNVRHVRTGQNGRYESEIQSYLNECLKLDANVDQTGRALIQDAAYSLLELGVIAIVPVDATLDIRTSNTYDIKSLRVGKITSWYPQHVRVEVYDENVGRRKEVVLPKRSVAIVENPLYEALNGPNSTLDRLVKKLSLLDTVDEATSSGKLDLIIQLPYVVKSDERKRQAKARRDDLQSQLLDSRLGVAYTDGTEKIVQLNRPLENNLLEQIKYLTGELYNRLGMTEAVFNGTADEAVLTNYHNRAIRPILDALTESMSRTFLTKTARSQGHTIMYIQDPFKFVTTSSIVTASDSLVRNEILTSNEIRSLLGYAPSSDAKADSLANPNINPHDGASADAGQDPTVIQDQVPSDVPSDTNGY